MTEIVLNRPAKLNAVTPPMAAEIERLCRALDRDDSVRAVVLRGAGDRAFCAGSDLNALAEYPSAWAFRTGSNTPPRCATCASRSSRRCTVGSSGEGRRWHSRPTSA